MTNQQSPHMDHNLHLGWKLKDLHHLHGCVMQAALTKIGLHSGQPRILFTVAHLEGASQKEIADHLHVTPASLATSMKRMQKAGFLARSIDEHDQRVNKIRLTDKGRQAIEACKEQMRIIDQTMQNCFSEKEQEQLAQYLERIYSTLNTLNARVNESIDNNGKVIQSEASEVNK